MVQNTSKVSRQQISDVLGHTFSESEFANCLQKIKTIKPKVGKFWQTAGAEAGVYIVVSGKVRLIGSSDELITNLTIGESFGEATFFPDADFNAYSARASRNLELCYLPPELLLTLVRKHPQIQEHLYQQAKKYDSLVTNINQDLTITKPEAKPVEVLTTTEQKIEKTAKKVNKAYFPNPSLKIGHLWQKVSRRYPFYAQQSASDCGAACLVMIGRYWGKKFSVNRLRDIANVDRNGASLKGLAAAAGSIGFTTRPVKASLNKLAEQNLPAIAHWEGKHYIVIYQITKDSVIVCDPAIGQLNYTHAQFKEGWTGYTLLLQPTALLKDAPEASTPFWQFFELVKPHGIVLLLTELNILKGIVCFWEGWGEPSLDCFEKWQKQLPETYQFIRAETELYSGLTRYIIGQKQEAIQFLNRKLCQLSLKEFSSNFRLTGGLLFIHLLSGNLPQGLEAAGQIEKMGKTNDSLYAEIWGHYGQAVAYLRANELDRALAHFCFVADNQYCIDLRVAIDALVGLTFTYQALQQPDAAQDTIEKLLEFAWEIRAPDMLSVAYSARARLALLQGDLPSVVKWVSSFQEEPDFPKMFYWLEVPVITQARALVAINSDQSLQEATNLLRKLWEGTEALHYNCQLIEIGVLQALALEKQGNRKEALAVLKSILVLTEPGGAMRPFIELGIPMADLLRRLHLKDSKSYFIQQLLEAFQISTVQPIENIQTLVEPLTQREAEILEMLSQRLQDKEIARHLCISPKTVKSHLKNLYQKLDVHNRRQAVVRAHDLGLLAVSH